MLFSGDGFEDGLRETDACSLLLSNVNVLLCGHLEHVSFATFNSTELNYWFTWQFGDSHVLINMCCYVWVCLSVCDSGMCVHGSRGMVKVPWVDFTLALELSGLCPVTTVQIKTGEPTAPAALNEPTLATTRRHRKYPFSFLSLGFYFMSLFFWVVTEVHLVQFETSLLFPLVSWSKIQRNLGSASEIVKHWL